MSSTGFSLWVLVTARPTPRKLKPAPPKSIERILDWKEVDMSVEMVDVVNATPHARGECGRSSIEEI
jgi:hypothetical protein